MLEKNEEVRRDFYVYGHYDLNGNLFYIGKGTGERKTATDGRSRAWQAAAYLGFTFKILNENLTEHAALSIESDLIKSTTGLVNVQSQSKQKEICNSVLSKYEYVDSSVCAISRTNGVKAAPQHIDSQGYAITTLNGNSYKVHRIVWTMHNGPIPDGMVIDHINRVRTDNRISNLRLVTVKENNLNKGNDEMRYIVTHNVDGSLSKFMVVFNHFGKKYCKTFQIKFFPDQAAALTAAKKFRDFVAELILNKEDISHMFTRKTQQQIDANVAKGLFEYDESSPTSLYWKVHRSNVCPVGTVAGVISKGHTPCIQFNGRGYSLRNVVWIVVNGSIPDNASVYSIDGDITNLRKDNLALKYRIGYC